MKKLIVALALGLASIASFAEASFEQVQVLIEQRQYQAAASGLEGIIQNHPKSAKAFYAMAQAQAGLGNQEKALKALNIATGLNPTLDFAPASSVASLKQAITPQVTKIEAIEESHFWHNFAYFALFAGFSVLCYFMWTIYARRIEEEAVKRGEEDAAALKRAEEWAERQEARRQAEEAQAAKEIAEYNAKQDALKAHKNYGHERFDPANPDKLKSVKQFKEEKLAEEMLAKARAEAAEAKARADAAEASARMYRTSAQAVQPTHTTVVNNSGNDMLTGVLIGNMISNSGHHHDTERVVTREVVREVPAPSRDSSWDDTPSKPARSSSWDDDSSSSSSKSSSSWSSSSSSDSSSSWDSGSSSSSDSSSSSSWD